MDHVIILLAIIQYRSERDHTMNKLALDTVRQFAKLYPADYDRSYFPSLQKARQGCVQGLKEVLEWKNANKAGCPMALSHNKQKFYELAAKNSDSFTITQSNTAPQAKASLRAIFANRAAVWGLFLEHIYLDSPIFDVYTNKAYHWFAFDQNLKQEDAKIKMSKTTPHHQLYDAYSTWFHKTLGELQKEDPGLTARVLDRALMMWGKYEGVLPNNTNGPEKGCPVH